MSSWKLYILVIAKSNSLKFSSMLHSLIRCMPFTESHTACCVCELPPLTTDLHILPTFNPLIAPSHAQAIFSLINLGKFCVKKHDAHNRGENICRNSNLQSSKRSHKFRCSRVHIKTETFGGTKHEEFIFSMNITAVPVCFASGVFYVFHYFHNPDQSICCLVMTRTFDSSKFLFLRLRTF